VGGAILSWLDEGGRVGDLERMHLRVTGRERSRTTPARLWARCCASTATCSDGSETMESSSTDECMDGTSSPTTPSPAEGSP
jgi:hypothetical protein